MLQDGPRGCQYRLGLLLLGIPHDWNFLVPDESEVEDEDDPLEGSLPSLSFLAYIFFRASRMVRPML